MLSWLNNVNDYICLEVLRPTQEFFRMESPLPVKCCNIWPIFSTHSNCAVRVRQRDTPAVTRRICFWWSSPRTLVTHTFCRALGSGAVTTCFYDFGMQGERFNRLVLRFRDDVNDCNCKYIILLRWRILTCNDKHVQKRALRLATKLNVNITHLKKNEISILSGMIMM